MEAESTNECEKRDDESLTEPDDLSFLHDSDDSESCKDANQSNISQPAKRRKLNNPFQKQSRLVLKKTGEPFLQFCACIELNASFKLSKCRECRFVAPNTKGKNIPCRFYAFRKLRYNKNGSLVYHSFSNPYEDPTEDDTKIWLGNENVSDKDIDVNQSRFILEKIGDQFCDLLQQEKMAEIENMNENQEIAWKRLVSGIREMCDVCETTLFNFHWTCKRCGFSVCIDCYKARKYGEKKIRNVNRDERDEYFWLICTNRSSHNQSELMLTQIITNDTLKKLAQQVHQFRALWNIPQYCGCSLSNEKPSLEMIELYRNAIDQHIGVNNENKVKNETNSLTDDMKFVQILSTNDADSDSSSCSLDDISPLKQLLELSKSEKEMKHSNEPNYLSNIQNIPKAREKNGFTKINYLPERIMTLSKSEQLYPNVKHSWLCYGRMLNLLDPICSENLKIFQDQWKYGQPVLVSDILSHMNTDIWKPEAFSKEFGDDANDLINCVTGGLVPNQPMKRFWDGFDFVNKRIKDENGEPMLLKLKDWPPGEDFAEILPTRFNDLMKALPLGEYTKRHGKYNLPSYLPDTLVKPDLGPKMYNAYGSALYPSKGTTNLHLDISDAVNVMVYVSVPKDFDDELYVKEAYKQIDDAGCDELTQRRIYKQNALPGAIWHIYAPRDADKIRDLLNKVTLERGERIEPNHDAIHDQVWYLDKTLRDRLYEEYGVEGFAIAQCLGDAVFVPAGAPHQVRNLLNCIKVAEDFVSPENVGECFKLTQEFRQLTETHSNHEDKLQIKNIIYHSVKECLTSLSSMKKKEFNQNI